MVHTLAWSPSGQLLAAGLGDGNCSVFSVQNRSLVQAGFLSPAHDASVASVLFPSFCDRERILLSAGNDGAILCWDLGSNVLWGHEDSNVDGQEHLLDPSTHFPPSLLEQTEASDVAKRLQDLSLGKPRILFGIPHGTKPNWMVSRKTPATVLVADTTNDITAYTIPFR